MANGSLSAHASPNSFTHVPEHLQVAEYSRSRARASNDDLFDTICASFRSHKQHVSGSAYCVRTTMRKVRSIDSHLRLITVPTKSFLFHLNIT